MTATITEQTGQAQAWKAPRYDLDAERAVLGAMMLNPDAIIDVETMLTVESFYPQKHRLIFGAITALSADGHPTDPVSVATRLADGGSLAPVGGAEYLHTVLAATPLVAQANYYAKIIAGLAQLRTLDQIVIKASQLVAKAGHADADAITEQIIDSIISTDRAVGTDDGPKPWRDLITPLLDEIETKGSRNPDEPDPHAVPTGWSDLDRLLGGGGKPGQVAVIAGRPGSAKSVTAMGWAQHAAMRLGIPAAVFSLEMGATELGMRMASAGTGIPFGLVESGKLSDGDWSRIGRWTGETADAPLYIDDTATLTVSDIRARARRLKQRHGIRLIVIDYLQLVSPGRSENRQVAVAAMSRSMKLLARELQCFVIVVAQLNRGPEQRNNKRPEVSDLRESGAIEADADVVILMHPMDDESNPRIGEIDVIVGKQRGGPKGTVTLAAQLHLMRLASLAVER